MTIVICINCHEGHDEEIDCPYCGYNDDNYCLVCTEKLLPHLDNDPNGEKNATCARCRAEEEHDFDIEPDAEFDRSGRLVEEGTWIELFKTVDGSRKYRHSGTGLAFFISPKYGTYDENGMPCAVRADGTLNLVGKQIENAQT